MKYVFGCFLFSFILTTSIRWYESQKYHERSLAYLALIALFLRPFSLDSKEILFFMYLLTIEYTSSKYSCFSISVYSAISSSFCKICSSIFGRSPLLYIAYIIFTPSFYSSLSIIASVLNRRKNNSVKYAAM